MQFPAFETGEFSKLVEKGDFKKALQTIFGMGDKPVVYARAFIEALEAVPPTGRQNLVAWCKAPMALQPISELQWYLDQIARHELGHSVVGRVLGFKTGDFTLLLKAANGDHVATSLTVPDTPTSTLADLEGYLERRVIVLMAGTMAEPKRGDVSEAEFRKAWPAEPATSDRQKVGELIQVLVNMRGKIGPREVELCFRDLASKTLQVVNMHHALICRIASILSGRITRYGQLATLSSEEFEEQLHGEKLVNPFGANPSTTIHQH